MGFAWSKTHFQQLFFYWLGYIIWLIFDGKILRNFTRFTRLQTAEGMRPRVANRNRIEIASKVSFPHL